MKTHVTQLVFENRIGSSVATHNLTPSEEFVSFAAIDATFTNSPERNKMWESAIEGLFAQYLLDMGATQVETRHTHPDDAKH